MATRISFPTAEAQYPWLKTVLDTYYISDAQVEEHLAHSARKGIRVACQNGCDACCRRPTVPCTEPELAALSWYACEVIEGDLRRRVKKRLIEYRTRLECPFLVDGSCSVHAVRPLSCRQFFVKDKPCAVGEDIAQSRPDDVIPLPRDTVLRPVAMRLLDHWKLGSPRKKQQAYESGFIYRQLMKLHEFDWTVVAKAMDRFDEASRGGSPENR